MLITLSSWAKADLTIIPTWDSTITSDPNHAQIEATINSAISNVEGDILNNVTASITFAETNTGLGESETYEYDESYSSYRSALLTNQTLSTFDTTALASLPVTTNNPVDSNADIQSTGPLLRALGFSASSGTFDTEILFNSTPGLVYENTGTPPGGEYSLQSVEAHEIDEALGIGGTGSQLTSGGSTTGPVGPLDLFRYSSNGTRSYTTASGADPYFSINGGATKLVYFNQSGTGDYADWGNGITDAEYGNTPPQVQDAFGGPGTNPQLSSTEVTALDVVGWNLTTQGSAREVVPEPSSLYLIFGGLLALLGLQRRYRKSA